MSTAHVALGANLGDRFATIQAAVDRIRELGSVRAISSFYETDPVGYLDQPSFVNAVLELQTELGPLELIYRLLGIESDLGRVRTFANAPRAIDLDLLLFDSVVMDSERLTLPHPRMLDRALVMVPLAEIAPALNHPLTGRSMSAHLDDLQPLTGIEILT
ncbi:2-amino-4-hydroxy-6-hydroxymethyldihydropteridinediphosphokinase [soil metagenome]